MHIEIRSWLNDKILHAGEFETLRHAVEDAVAKDVVLDRARLDDANLDGARLDRASLDGASLDGARLDGARLDGASLDGARLDGARLDGARLDRASLGPIRADFWSVLMFAPAEIAALRTALVEGRVEGSMYDGECACLVGTIANARHCSCTAIPGLKPDSDRPAERWFLAIHKGDTAESNQIVAITLKWIDEFMELAKAFAATPVLIDDDRR